MCELTLQEQADLRDMFHHIDFELSGKTLYESTIKPRYIKLLEKVGVSFYE